MDKTEAKNEAKKTCPSCCSTKTTKDYMSEDGVQIPIRKCTDCKDWW